jgi:hypothetical protein
LHFLLTQPRLDPILRRMIFETTQQSSDRKHAVDESVFKAAMQATGTTPPKKPRKEKTNG